MSEKPLSESLLLRILVLAALLAAINAWAVRHLGEDLPGLTYVNAAVALFAVIFGLLREQEQKDLAEVRRRLLERVLDRTVLTAVAIVFALVGSSLSSVTVLAGSIGGEHEVVLQPEGRGDGAGARQHLRETGDMVRYLRFTTPFGRSFSTEVDGYLRHSFELYPWIGAKIRLDRDLRRVPAVLVRVPFVGFPHRKSGRLRLTLAGTSHDIPLDGKAAVVLGRRMSAPLDRVEEWRSELKADDVEGAMAETLVRAWKDALAFDKTPGGAPLHLAPGSDVTVELYTRGGKVVAGATFLVSDRTFQDVKMIKTGGGS